MYDILIKTSNESTYLDDYDCKCLIFKIISLIESKIKKKKDLKSN